MSTDPAGDGVDGRHAGTVTTQDGTEIPVTLSDGIVQAAADADDDIDLDRIRDAAVPPSTVDLTADTHGDDPATVPVQDHRETDLTSRLERDRDFTFIQDPQIRRLLRQHTDYTERVGRFMLARDDLVPTVKERLKALIIGQDGLGVDPSDPDDDADQRLADHLSDRYREIRPSEVIDSILRENFMNARAVLRASDLNELDLGDLDYLQDGITGREIYVQDRATVYTFDIQDGDDPGDDLDTDLIDGLDIDRTTIDPQPLVIGDQVFDVSLYDTPPLEAVADAVVNKMVLQRLKARKAEITAFGGVYAEVKPPTYLSEDQYFDRVRPDDWDGSAEDTPPTKLEVALNENIQQAFDTLKDFQSGTVMAVPSFWELKQLDIPETNNPLDDQIRGYNRDISRRLLVPLDLIELQSGSELSRETMFSTLMTTIAGWRREILRVFDQFAQKQAEVHDIDGEVDHSFPPLRDANAELIVQSLQYAGVAGMDQAEVRQLLNAVQGIDLDTDADQAPDAPPAGGPDDPAERADQMRDLLDDQRRGGVDDGADDGDGSDDQGPTVSGYEHGDSGGVPEGDRFDSEQAARRRADEIGCQGAHQMPDGRWMPCSTHSAYDSATAADASDVDTTPPDAAVNAAQQALDARDDPDVTVNGMTDVGWSTAETLAAGDALPADKVVGSTDSMANWWARHAGHTVDTSGERATLATDDATDGNPWSDPSYTAGKGWGGIAGARWAWRTAADITGDDDWMAHLDDLTAAIDAAGIDRPTMTLLALSSQSKTVLDDLPFVPDGDSDDIRITRPMLANLLAWVRSGRPRLDADWNPALHPRGPDGQFVERPFDVPDPVASEVNDLGSAELLDRLAGTGAMSGGDVDALLQDDSISIDGVPDDIDSRGALQDVAVDQADPEGADYASPGAQALDPSTADSVQPLGATDADSGASAAAMSVADWDDGRKAFVTNIDADAADGVKPELAERSVAGDRFFRNIGLGDAVPRKVLDRDQGFIAKEAVDGVSAFSAGDRADRVDPDDFRRVAAAVMLSGDSDIHGQNLFVQDDGTLKVIDQDKAGGDFSDGGKFAGRGADYILQTASALGIDMDENDLRAATEDLARELDPDAAVDGIPNSQVSDADRHQFRQNIAENIDAAASGGFPP